MVTLYRFLCLVALVALAASSLPAQTWQPTNGPVGARLATIGASDRGIITGWVGVSEWDPSTQNWVDAGLQDTASEVWKVFVDRDGALWLATSNGLYRRNDDNGAWQRSDEGVFGTLDEKERTGLHFGGKSIQDVERDSSGAMWALRGTSRPGIYRSIDDGRTWTPIGLDGGQFYQDLVVHRDGSIIVLHRRTDGRNAIARSSDGGAAWQVTEGILPGAQAGFLAAGPDGDLWIGANRFASDDTTNGLYRSSDAGRTWRRGGFRSVPVYDMHVDRRERLYVVADDLYRSGDNGTSWSVFPGFGARAVADGGAEGLFAVGEGALRSTDDGATWSTVDNGLHSPAITSIAAASSTTLYAGLVGFGGLQRTTDAGRTWVNLPPAPQVASARVEAVGTNGSVLASADRILYRTLDGVEWRPLDTISTQLFWSGLGRDGRAYVAYEGAGLFRYETTGERQLVASPDARFVGISLAADETLLLADVQQLRMSTDGGSSWTTVPTLEPVIGAPLLTRRRTLIAPTESGVLRSTDLGDTWSASADRLPSLLSETSAGDLYAELLPGVVGRSVDEGSSWQVVDSAPRKPVPFAAKFSVADDGTLYVATSGGVYRRDAIVSGAACPEAPSTTPHATLRILGDHSLLLATGPVSARSERITVELVTIGGSTVATLLDDRMSGEIPARALALPDVPIGTYIVVARVDGVVIHSLVAFIDGR
jgi:photosystem II stability/assembly factor-like uncharacterized protein